MKEKNQMLEKKKVYRVYENHELWNEKEIDFLHGIWCTDNFEYRNMNIQDLLEKSECISGCIIDKTIKNCLIFTVFDSVNYPIKEDEIVEISYDDLLKYCEEIEMIYYVDNKKIKE